MALVAVLIVKALSRRGRQAVSSIFSQATPGTVLLFDGDRLVDATPAGRAIVSAGLAGGVMFDVFRPAASVRGLALIRTAARYAERMLGHDATLRALSRLRGALYSGITRLPHEQHGEQ